MHCTQCPTKLLAALEKAFPKPLLEVEGGLTLDTPVVYVSYTPELPAFTIRHVVEEIQRVDPAFEVSVYHPPTIEERSQQIQRRERNDLLRRLVFNVVCAIPTLLIGIVWMMLVSPNNSQRMFFDEYMWAGTATRGEWALLFISTPVMFYCAEPFHRRAIKEIAALWRRGSPVPIARRFYRFGSMNLLISLGVSIAYFASIVMLVLATQRDPHHSMKAHATTYFDSTVFLSMFLLMGK
jgi:Cu+-exporting ATPase